MRSLARSHGRTDAPEVARGPLFTVYGQREREREVERERERGREGEREREGERGREEERERDGPEVAGGSLLRRQESASARGWVGHREGETERE